MKEEKRILWSEGGVMGRRSGRQQVEQQALPPPSHQNSGWRGGRKLTIDYRGAPFSSLCPPLQEMRKAGFGGQGIFEA